VTPGETRRGPASPGVWAPPGAPARAREAGDGCFDEQTVLDLLAGALPEERLASAERHLGTCEACADLLCATAPLLIAQLAPALTG